jgi:cathepsin B
MSDKNFATILRSMNTEVDKKAKSLIWPSAFEAPKMIVNFDGRDTWKEYLTPIYDQKNCAACYAFSTISCLSDRYALQTLLQVKPFFNPLASVICFTSADSVGDFEKLTKDLNLLQKYERTRVNNACKGDTIYSIGNFLYHTGAIENSCVPMKNIQDTMEVKGRLPTCSNVQGIAQTDCLNKTTPQRVWPISLFYSISGNNMEDTINHIKIEVMKWGPMTVAFKVFKDFLDYDGKSIYIPKNGQTAIGGHAVKLIGWGIDPDKQTPYWLCANSWGVKWGDEGYFKIVQGNDLLELEYNNMSVWPFINGAENVPYTDVKNLVTKKMIQEREIMQIDPVTFYPRNVLNSIKTGKIVGSLKPVIDISLVPLTNDFYAFEIGSNTFLTFGGTYINTTVNKTILDSLNTNKKINNLFLSVLYLIGFIIAIVIILLIKCILHLIKKS